MSFLGRLFGKTPPDGLLDPRAYAEHYAAAVRRAHPGTEVTVHAAATAAHTRVEWRTPTGWDSKQFFGNFHARYLLAPEELTGLIAAQMAEAEAVGREPAPADWLGAILPALKTAAWRDTTARQLGAAGVESRAASFVVRPLVADLVVTYVVDTPELMSFVHIGELDKRGIDAEALHAAALANLARRLPDLRIEGGGGRYAARLDRNYDTSMVLLLDQWRERVGIDGDLVVALPARDELLMCPAGDPETAASLAAMAARIVERSAYGLTARLLAWRGGRLEALAG